MGDSAVALRYAEALYALAREQGKTGPVLEDLALLKSALQSDGASWTRLMHPRASAAEKDQLLRDKFLSGRDPLVANTVRLLVEKRREGTLADFFRVYLEVHERNEGILRVEVETATPLDPSVRDSILQKLSATTGKQVVLEDRVDPSLLGGMRFIVGSQLLDGSVRSRLERIARGLRAVPVETR